MQRNKFTFHYASIKTETSDDDAAVFGKFTFHYASIKTLVLCILGQTIICNLHFTMLLLKR